MSDHLLKTSKALGDSTRLSIYRYLKGPLNEPATARKLANRFNLHVSAIRQHMVRLEDAGLIISESLKSKGSGRPQRVYQIRGPFQATDLLPRDYKLLCEILLEYLKEIKVSPDQMRKYGHQWTKRSLYTKTIKFKKNRSIEEVGELLHHQFSGLGFDPMLANISENQIGIRFQNCIFLEAARAFPDLLCPLVHGLLDGFLSAVSGQQSTSLDNGIAHGGQNCEMLISIKNL